MPKAPAPPRRWPAPCATRKLNPDAIDYINAHGTSTPLGDKAETIAIKTVFGDHARKVSISSTKSQLGHLLGASGGVELVLCMKALVAQRLPADDQLHDARPGCDLDYTPNTPRERKLRAVMSNSFGFGGHNASIIAGGGVMQDTQCRVHASASDRSNAL